MITCTIKIMKLKDLKFPTTAISPEGHMQVTSSLDGMLNLNVLYLFNSITIAKLYSREIYPQAALDIEEYLLQNFFDRTSDQAIKDLKRNSISRENINKGIEPGCVGISYTATTTFMRDSVTYRDCVYDVFYKIANYNIGGWCEGMEKTINEFIDANGFPVYFKDTTILERRTYPGGYPSFPILQTTPELSPLLFNVTDTWEDFGRTWWEERPKRMISENTRIKSLLSL